MCWDSSCFKFSIDDRRLSSKFESAASFFPNFALNAAVALAQEFLTDAATSFAHQLAGSESLLLFGSDHAN